MGERTCLVCGHAGFSRHLEILLKCTTCGFVTADLDSLPKSNVREIYQGDYFTGGEYLDYRADEAFFKKNFRKRLHRVLKRQSCGRLLEIGSAYGFFLDLAQSYFEVVGYEVNECAAEHACRSFGIDVRTNDFLQANVNDIGGLVDVTVMWDVIEHLQRPDHFIQHIAELSKPGAWLYVTTGDIGSLVARMRGRKWRMIHPPTHLHYFDRQTLPRLLEKYGFQVVEKRSIGVARSIHQILYSLLVLNCAKTEAYERLKKIIPGTWGFTVNIFDIIQIAAKYVGR